MNAAATDMTALSQRQQKQQAGQVQVEEAIQQQQQIPHGFFPCCGSGGGWSAASTWCEMHGTTSPISTSSSSSSPAPTPSAVSSCPKQPHMRRPFSPGTSNDHRNKRKPPSKRRTQDIEYLRHELARLKHLLKQLEQARDQDNETASSWKLLAQHEAALRLEAVHENDKLKKTLGEARRLVQGLAKGVDKTARVVHSLGSIEELEWKMGVLSLHPTRRKYNADRIMNQFLNEIPSRVITSGLTEIREPSYCSQVANLDRLDRTVHQEVKGMQFFSGSYLELAEVFWKCRHEVVPTQTVSYVENAVTEQFDENTICRLARCVVDNPNDQFRYAREEVPLKQMLMRRFVNEGCVMFASKEVRETLDTPPSMEIVDNVCGWFALQDGGLDEHGKPRTIFKSSFHVDIKPLSNRLERMLLVAKRIQLGEGTFPECSTLDASSRKSLEQQLRELFVEYIQQVLWRIQMGRQEALSAYAQQQQCHLSITNTNKMQMDYLTSGRSSATT